MQGRLYDGHVYDMIELGLTKYVSLEDHTGEKKAIGSNPLMVFAGEAWERSKAHEVLRNIILGKHSGSSVDWRTWRFQAIFPNADVFGARDITGISLQGIDHVISVVATADECIHFRPYGISFMKADGRIPRVELHSMGPDMDFSLRRTHFPSSDLTKAAHRVPKE
jgi:ribosome production factor 2